MDDKELKQILATKAPAYQRSLIEIPKDCFAPHHSSLTDYLDSVLGDSREMQNRIDNLVMRYRLGAVDKTKNEHFGTILPRINKKGMIVGGSVIYYNTDGGTIIEKDSLVAHLYSANICSETERRSSFRRRKLLYLGHWHSLISTGWQLVSAIT